MEENELLVGWINLLARKTRRFCDQSLARIGLTGVQGRILSYIVINSRLRDIFQKDVEEEFSIRASSASGLIRQLEYNGMIQRVGVAHDARLKKLVPTEAAVRIQEQILQESARTEARLRADLSAEEVKLFVNFCERISKSI